MDQAISAAEANRMFSRILRDVRAGTSFTITAHGKPVARIVPYDPAEEAQTEARANLLQRLDRQPIMDIGAWRRDELYER